MLDLFVTNNISLGEVESLVEVRYFEAAQVQQAFVPEGQSSLVVNIPVIDDNIDEGDENLEVALVSRLTQSFDLQTTAVFDNQFDVVATEAYNALDGDVVLEIDIATVQNIKGSTLAAGTVLNFNGGAIATVVSDKYLDNVDGPQSVFVTLDPGGTQSIAVGERATTTFDNNVNILVFEEFDGSTVGLRIGGLEIPNSLVLTQGTQLTFQVNGTVLSVDEDTTIDVYSTKSVPVSFVSGTTVF